MDYFCGPPLTMLQQVQVSPVLRTPHLDTVLQVRSHSAEERDHLPGPAGHAAFDAAQGMVGLLGSYAVMSEAYHRMVWVGLGWKRPLEVILSTPRLKSRGCLMQIAKNNVQTLIA